MNLYRTRSHVVEAIRWDGNEAEVTEWLDGFCIPGVGHRGEIYVETPETIRPAFLNDWIVKTGSGFRVYSDTDFTAAYEPVLQ